MALAHAGRIVLSAVAILLLTARLPVSAGAHSAPPNTYPPTSFQSLGYGDSTAQFMYGSLSYFFPLPQGRVPSPGSDIVLDYSHSPLLVPSRSTMTVIVNGQSVESVFLTSANRNHGHLSVHLPTQGFRGDGYFVQVRFLLRLSRDPCEQVQNPALWATVFGDSVLRLGTHPSGARPQLQDLSSLFTPRAGASQASALPALTVPMQASSTDLAAAGLLAFQVGRWAAAGGTDPQFRITHGVPPGTADIAVGMGATLHPPAAWGSIRWTGTRFQAPNSSQIDAAGLLAMAASPIPHLLVSGATSTGLEAAANALVNPGSRSSLHGKYALVRTIPAATHLPYAWERGAASFAELGQDQQTVTGPGSHPLTLTFDRPPGWLLQPGSTLDLEMVTSPAAVKSASWIQVSLNGKDIGSRRLEAGGSQPNRYRFQLPADRLDTTLGLHPLRQLSLNLRVFLSAPQRGCTELDPDTLWATILPSSSWFLKHTTYNGFDLARFPAPLMPSSGGQTLVILPEHFTWPELRAGLRIMAGMGRWSTAQVGLPRLIPASSATQSELGNGQVVLIGGPNRNRVSADAAKKAADLFRIKSPPIGSQPSAISSGFLRLAPSPWSSGHAVLLVLGSSDAAILHDADALTRSALLGQINGRAVALGSGMPPQTIEAAQPVEPSPASLAPQLEQTSSSPGPPPWQVVGAVLLAAFLAAIGILLYAVFGRRGTHSDGESA